MTPQRYQQTPHFMRWNEMLAIARLDVGLSIEELLRLEREHWQCVQRIQEVPTSKPSDLEARPQTSGFSG